MSNLKKRIIKATTINTIKIIKKNGNRILQTDIGDLFFYKSDYEFRSLNETNIPVSTYDQVSKYVTGFLILFKGNYYLVNKRDILKKPRINKKLKLLIYPLPKEILKPLMYHSPQKKQSKFIHLHTHCDYSSLDGVSNCKSYLEKAKELGMDALAITDHGNMSAHMDLQLRSKEIGIRPIFGVEMYIVDNTTLHDGDHRSSNHIVLLAKNGDGYKNLIKLQQLSWSTENYYYRPRIDFETLRKHRHNLVVMTACLKGVIATDALNDNLKTAIKKLKLLHKMFKNDLYLELQLHNIIDEDGDDIQKIYNKILMKLSKKLDINLVITNDVHYSLKGMHKVQEKIIRIRMDSDISKTYCHSIWLKSYDEIKKTWNDNCGYIPKSIFDKAIASTREIADKCVYEIPTGGLKIPKVNLKDFPGYKVHMTEEDYLRKRIMGGLALKTAFNMLSAPYKVYVKRLEHEIDAFVKMKVISYIFIYDDLIRFLKKNKCLCSLRGSANGSVVLWLMELSIVDPIKYDILFERFISPARIQNRMADIDIDLDISHTFRDMAINYLKDKYGDDHICSVGSFSRTQLKGAIKALSRVEAATLKEKIDKARTDKLRKKLIKKLEPFSFQEMNKITKIMPDDIDKIEDSKVASWFEENKSWYNKYVKPILGNVYAESLHPAAIIISPEPINEWLPVRTNKLSKEKGGERVFATQWENSHTYEEFLNERGVTVLDVLGVKTLTVISETIDLIKKRHNETFTLQTIPIDDKQVYKTLSNGENLGYFQLGKEQLKGLLRKTKPDKIEDMIFLIAADRPGPLASQAPEQYIERKHGLTKIKYLHPSLKNVLNDTLGVLVYSEHVMKTATEFAGMNAIDAEEMRKVIKAKNPEDFKVFKERFIKEAIRKWTKK